MNAKWLLMFSLATTLVACEKRETKNANTNTNASTQVEEVDNTGRNVRDSDFTTKTSGDQAENQSDINITKTIRAAIINNESLSTNAKNIKIITINGIVTLRGVVASELEKNAIVKIINNAGFKKVDNQLEVKNSQ